MGISTFRTKILFGLIAFFAGLALAVAQCPTVDDPTQSFCDLESPTVANLQATSNGNGLAWYSVPVGGSPLSMGAGLVNGTTYYADNSLGNCGARPSVTVTIYRRPDGQAFQGPCVDSPEEATLADFDVTGNNIQWYLTPTGGSPLPLTTQLVEGTIYYASQTNPDTGCETSRLAVLATVGVVPVPTGPSVQQFCIAPGNPTPTVADLVASGNNNWYTSPSSAVPLNLSTPLVHNQFYYATTVDLPCESENRLEVLVDLVQPSNPGTDGEFQICEEELATAPPLDLFTLLGGNPENTGTWSGPVGVTNGFLGTLNLASLTVAGSPYEFTYTINTNVCGPRTSTVIVTILPVPVASISGTATICAETSSTITFLGTPNAVVTYTVNGGAPQTITLDASGDASISQTFTGTTIYELVSVATTGTPVCSQPLTGSATVTVVPLPNASIASDVTICAGQQATITFTGTPNATITYNINGGANLIVALNAEGTATITNTYTDDTTYNLVSVTSAGSPSCTRILNGSVTVTVIPTPTVSISGSTTICPDSSATVTFTGTPNAVVTYNINGGPNLTINLNGSGTATLTNTYSATTVITLVSVEASGTPSCLQTASGSVTITVLPLPTATVSGTITICSGQSATVIFTGTPNATVTYNINGDPNQTITLDASGNASITDTYTETTVFNLVSVSSAGTPSCSQPLADSVTITVVPPPTASIAGNQTICPNENATVTFTGTPNATITYNINGGSNQTITLDGAGNASITASHSATTVFNLVSVATAGTPRCTQPATGSITITVVPPPTVSISENATICTDESATVTFTGTPNAVVTYTVNGGTNQTITLDNAGTATITDTYSETTTFTLVSVETSGTPACPGTVGGSVTITVLPLPEVSISGTTTICSGQQATVTFTGTPNAVVTYQIDGGANQTITLDVSGNASITGTYTATTSISLVGVATTGTPSCSQPQSGTVTISVLPPPTASIAVDSNPVCSGGTATITFTGTPDAVVTYNINGGPNLTITLDASGNAALTTTFTSATVYSLVSVSTSGTPTCTMPVSGSVSMDVIPLPTASIASDQTICSGNQATISFTGTPNAVVTYSINGGPNLTVALDENGTASITNAYTANAIFNLVSVATTGTPSCSQPVSGSATITIVPLPIASISGSTTVCPGENATITFTGTPLSTVTYTVNGETHTITLDAAGTATVDAAFSANAVFNLVSVTTAGTPGCTRPVAGSVVITVLPPPTASVSANVTICSGDQATVTFTGTPNAVVTYNINGDVNQTITLDGAGTASITDTYTSTTVFNLVSVATSGTPVCTQPLAESMTITVILLPEVSLSSDTAVCEGQQATVTFTGTPNAVVTYNINGGANQTITLDGSGTATITDTYTATTVINLVSVSTAGTPTCTQPQSGSMTITVLPPPTASMTVEANPVCSGTDAVILLTGTPDAIITISIGGATQTVTLDGSGNGSLSVSVSSPTTIELISATTGGTPSCTQPLSGSVDVDVLPLPTASISGSATLCPGAEATITFTGTPNATVSFNIDGGPIQTVTLNGAGNAFYTSTFDTTTTINLVSVASAGTPVCEQPISGSVTIDIQLPPVVTISSDTTICSGQLATVNFSGPAGAIVTFTVNGDEQTIILDGTGAASVTNIYTAITVFELVSAVTTGTPGCSAPQTGTATITVIQPPVVTISGSTTVCTGDTATITFTGTPNAVVTYNINGGANQTITLDGNGIATIESTFTAETVYNLVSIATSGTPQCLQPQTGSVTISIVPPPTANISATQANICSGTSATVTFTGTPNATVIYKINGAEDLTVQLDATGTATVTPTLDITSTFSLVSVTTSGTPACTQSVSDVVVVVVTPQPSAGTDVANFETCESAGTIDLFTLLGPDAQTGGTWSPALSGGNGTFNPLVDAPGTYTYTVAGSGPCADDTATVTVSIVPPPHAGEDATLSICSNADAVDLFTLLGPDAQTGGTWTPSLSGGGNVFNPGVDAGGVYTYTVTGAGPCGTDSSTVTISVTPGPDAGENGSLTLCVDSDPQDLFNFLNGTPQVGGVWSPTLASGSGVFNPAVDAPGVYTYTFFGNQPCDNDTATVTVTVNPLPDAGTDGIVTFCTNFAPADLFNYLGGTPQAGGTWSPALSSGTGVFNPAVDSAGVYTYTVGGNFCSLDTATVTVTLLQSPNAGGPGQTINVCATSGEIDLTTGLNGSQGAGTWSDDSASGALSGSMFNPAQAGVGTYNFTYTVGGGISPCETDTATVTVVVDPQPNAGVFAGSQSVCTSAGTFDLASLLNDELAGGVWTDANGATVDGLLDVSGMTAGTYTFTYTLANACGTDAEQVQFTILPIPTLGIPNITLNTPICIGSSSQVTLSGMADGTYNINFNLTGANVVAGQTATVTIAGGTGSFTVPAANLTNTGITTINFESIVNNTTSCSSQLANVLVNLVVDPLPTLASANINVATICQGTPLPVSITGAQIADGTYQFNFTIPGATPATGTATATMTGGNGQFVVPASHFMTLTGSQTITINGIISTTGGCGNTAVNASANFDISPAPNIAGASIAVGDTCVNQSATIAISGANALSDGMYTIEYQLSGASTASGSSAVQITSGEGSIVIPASDLTSAGPVTVTISNVVSIANDCGTSGTSITPVTFNVGQPGTPQLGDQGNEFCAEDNPTVANLTGNIVGLQNVVWYDAPTGGNVIAEETPLVDGQTYYASHVAGAGCESLIRLEVTVAIEKCELDDIMIPDGFSPNNDGINDEFVIVNLHERYPKFKLEIYNRYGNILYRGNVNTPNWDGKATEGGIKMGSGEVPVGVYFYILEFNDGVRKPIQGRLYLSR